MPKTIKIEIKSTIEIPEGKKLVFKNGEFIVEDIPPVLPETWEEFCELCPVQSQECYIDDYSVINEATDRKSVV